MFKQYLDELQIFFHLPDCWPEDGTHPESQAASTLVFFCL
jgi:hypothetical protein